MSLPLDAFGTDSRVKDGRKGKCRPCEAAAVAEWRAANKERYTVVHRTWREANRERVRETNRRWTRSNPEEQARRTREKHLRNKYGITGDDYARMLREQNDGCAACGYVPPQGAPLLHIDHCHASGAVRGLLCQPCNTTLGLVRDDPDRLRSLARYLESSGTLDMVTRAEKAGVPVKYVTH